MTRVNVAEAKARLSELIEAACAGDEVVIARRGVPLVRLVRLPQKKGRPTFGKLRGQIRLAPDFDAPLDELAEYR
ncbi:MAG: type II toxin-antitoxin system prevent-host-death family antitoxin [Myxococcales bacterium]|nr:type II toxin-antitoxin system prevent-host-death family antitoxin [Myxococcales bacterium]MCC6523759.1 type II toxin-antitoxin system prevent-host-death family antitoxin [Polyangiaceae bacterium]